MSTRAEFLKDALLDDLRDEDDEVLELGALLSPAMHIDRRLLRNTRFRFLRTSDAGLESRFWFSGLVDTRSTDVITIDPNIAFVLGFHLHKERPERFDQAWVFINEQHEYLPSLLRLQEEIRHALIIGNNTRELFARILNTLRRLRDPEQRRAMGRSLKETVGGLPASHRNRPEVRWIAAAVALELGDVPSRVLSTEKSPAPPPAWLTAGRSHQTPHAIGLLISPGVLAVTKSEKPAVELRLADPPPVPLLVACNHTQDDLGRWFMAHPGRRLALHPPTCLGVTITTPDGRQVRVWAEPLSKAKTKDSRLPSEARLAIVYSPEDEKLAQRIQKTLSQHDIATELVRQDRWYAGVEKTDERSDHRDVFTLRLWSRNTTMTPWDELVVTQREQQQTGLVVRLDDSPLPEGTMQVHTLDLFGWDGDPDAAAAMQLLRGIRTFIEKSKPSEEIENLLAEIATPKTKPERRLEIGDRLAKLGDPRPGVGLRSDGLPEIEWVKISAGAFLYGEGKEKRHLDTFWIARYPITNAQYQAFIDDGGYKEDRWWKGLAERIEKRDPDWSEPNRPRETVTWYEAVAFCRWLTQRYRGIGLLDKVQEISLPTEFQWEKAARGTDGREYPWGDGYRAGYANINEKGTKAGPSYLRQTTAVGIYPQGVSPYGVEDMAGNVWEWCLNKYEQPDNTSLSGAEARVVRGGSWIGYPAFARAVFRFRDPPDFRNYHQGFRVVRVSPMDTEH